LPVGGQVIVRGPYGDQRHGQLGGQRVERDSIRRSAVLGHDLRELVADPVLETVNLHAEMGSSPPTVGGPLPEELDQPVVVPQMMPLPVHRRIHSEGAGDLIGSEGPVNAEDGAGADHVSEEPQW
jgi:hypothetical protein